MRKLVIYILILTVGAGCREKYELPYTGPSAGYLVVDGVINSGQGPTIFRLSRTLGLVDSVNFIYERHAMVRVEGDNNTSFLLPETDLGVYSSPQLTLQDNVKYRVRINTSEGKSYISDFASVKKTPDIDGISWERNDEGVQLFVNSHDPLNNTHYYKWEYDETWEYHSNYLSTLRYVYDQRGKEIDVEPRPYDEMMKLYYCWAHDRSTNLLIGSTLKLSRDTIHLPLLSIPQGSWKISVLYSILVKQYALSREGYEFLQRMKKNTEQLGTLFDAQPSELVGNIKNVEDPNEIVIGFVEVAEAKEKRLFISRSEVSPWVFRMSCYEESILNHPDSISGAYVPTSTHIQGPMGNIVRFYASTEYCVDCNKRGSNLKPSFWP